MKTIAIAVSGVRICSRLEYARNVLLLTVEGSRIKKRETIRLVQSNPFEKINFLIQLDVNVVICGGITEICLDKLKNNHIEVVPWVRGDTEEVLQQFLENKIKPNL